MSDVRNRLDKAHRNANHDATSGMGIELLHFLFVALILIFIFWFANDPAPTNALSRSDRMPIIE